MTLRKTLRANISRLPLDHRPLLPPQHIHAPIRAQLQPGRRPPRHRPAPTRRLTPTGNQPLRVALPLNALQIRTRQIPDPPIPRPTAPPLARIADRVGFAQDGDEVALPHRQIDARDGGVGREVVQDAAEVELAGVEGLRLRLRLLRWREGLAVGPEDGVLAFAGGFFLAAGEGVDEFAHEVGEAEDGEEEHDEWFFGGAGWSGGAVGEDAGDGAGGGGGEALEGGEGGGREGHGVGGGRAAGDFGEEGAEPAEEGEDAEDGAEGGAEVAELFGDRDHCCSRVSFLGSTIVGKELQSRPTEKRRMSRHICTFEHLCEAAKGADDALDDLEGGLRALTEAVGQTVWVVRVSLHPSHPTHATVHATAVAAHASVHPS